jgi:AcrR family transcriptional regulator
MNPNLPQRKACATKTCKTEPSRVSKWLRTLHPVAGTETRARGRTAAASRDDVRAAARQRFLAGERVDVQAIAGELGVGRATVYRWFGSRERLIGEVLVDLAERVVALGRAQVDGTRPPGPERLLDRLDAVNRLLAEAGPLLRFVETERGAALRVITAGGGIVQPAMVGLVAGLIDDEVAAGAFRPAVDPETLAYAIVRLGEAFLYNDAAAGMRGDVERLREVEALLLGLTPAS